MKEDEYGLTEVISFRLSKAFLKKLKKYSKGKIDDYGRGLNENKAARKIVIEALLCVDAINIKEEKSNHAE